MQKRRTRLILLIACLLPAIAALVACTKKAPEKGKVVLKNYQFVMHRDGHNIVVDAVGTAWNVGDCDVKHVVITGDCPSCQQMLVTDKWFDSNLPATPDEEAIIDYLPKGATAKFRVKNIAMMVPSDQKKTVSNLPDKISVKVVSFISVQ